MVDETQKYNNELDQKESKICDSLAKLINTSLPEAENKVWHGHPVWFLDGNPIVGYSKQKAGIRLMFWSGVGFDEPSLTPSESRKYKDASIFYNSIEEINSFDVERWLEKSKNIQWDYKNIVKRKGELLRLV